MKKKFKLTLKAKTKINKKFPKPQLKPKLFLNKVEVRKSNKHGYGVFALKDFTKGELIEECYIILTKGGDKVLDNFYFDANRKYAVFLGYGSIYNHDKDPNANYTINNKKRLATIKARKRIRKNEEIFVSYSEQWFKDRGIEPK